MVERPSLMVRLRGKRKDPTKDGGCKNKEEKMVCTLTLWWEELGRNR